MWPLKIWVNLFFVLAMHACIRYVRVCSIKSVTLAWKWNCKKKKLCVRACEESKTQHKRGHQVFIRKSKISSVHFLHFTFGGMISNFSMLTNILCRIRFHSLYNKIAKLNILDSLCALCRWSLSEIHVNKFTRLFSAIKKLMINLFLMSKWA